MYKRQIVEWAGWAILTCSLSGLVFLWWTIANLVPRANAIWHRYREEFGDEVEMCIRDRYKVSTPAFQENPEASKLIRRYNARIVEVNPVFSIVEKNGMLSLSALFVQTRTDK